eukprot:PhM_4_TR14640/c0_g1_i1/m.34004
MPQPKAKKCSDSNADIPVPGVSTANQPPPPGPPPPDHPDPPPPPPEQHTVTAQPPACVDVMKPTSDNNNMVSVTIIFIEVNPEMNIHNLQVQLSGERDPTTVTCRRDHMFSQPPHSWYVYKAMFLRKPYKTLKKCELVGIGPIDLSSIANNEQIVVVNIRDAFPPNFLKRWFLEDRKEPSQCRGLGVVLAVKEALEQQLVATVDDLHKVVRLAIARLRGRNQHKISIPMPKLQQNLSKFYHDNALVVAVVLTLTTFDGGSKDSPVKLAGKLDVLLTESPYAVAFATSNLTCLHKHYVVQYLRDILQKLKLDNHHAVGYVQRCLWALEGSGLRPNFDVHPGEMRQLQPYFPVRCRELVLARLRTPRDLRTLREEGIQDVTVEDLISNLEHSIFIPPFSSHELVEFHGECFGEMPSGKGLEFWLTHNEFTNEALRRKFRKDMDVVNDDILVWSLIRAYGRLGESTGGKTISTANFPQKLADRVTAWMKEQRSNNNKSSTGRVLLLFETLKQLEGCGVDEVTQLVRETRECRFPDADTVSEFRELLKILCDDNSPFANMTDFTQQRREVKSAVQKKPEAYTSCLCEVVRTQTAPIAVQLLMSAVSEASLAARRSLERNPLWGNVWMKAATHLHLVTQEDLDNMTSLSFAVDTVATYVIALACDPVWEQSTKKNSKLAIDAGMCVGGLLERESRSSDEINLLKAIMAIEQKVQRRLVDRITSKKDITMYDIEVIESCGDTFVEKISQTAGTPKRQLLSAMKSLRDEYRKATVDVASLIANMRECWSQHPALKQRAATYVEELAAMKDQFAHRPIMSLDVALGASRAIEALSVELRELQQLHTFRSMWRMDTKSVPVVPADADDTAIISTLTQILNDVREATQALWEQLDEGAAPHAILKHLDGIIRVPDVLGDIAHDAGLPPKDLRERLVALVQEARQLNRVQLQSEIDLARKLLKLPRLGGEKERVYLAGRLCDALESPQVLHMGDAMRALLRRLGGGVPSQCPLGTIPPREELNAFISSKPLSDVSALAQRVLETYPELRTVPPAYPMMFLQTVERGLVKQLTDVRSVDELARVVAGRLEAIVDDQAQETLSAFLTVVEALSNAGQQVFQWVKSGSVRDARVLAQILENTCGAVLAMDVLRRGVDNVHKLLNDNDDELSIIKARRLLVRGTLDITLDAFGRAHLTASYEHTTSSPQPSESNVTLSFDDLNEISAQIALAAHAEVDDDDADEEESRAEEMESPITQMHVSRTVASKVLPIGTTEGKRHVIALFTSLRDQLEVLLAAFNDFATAGHPSHRDERASLVMPLDGTNVAERIEYMSDIAREINDMSRDWSAFLTEIRVRLPALAFLSRATLADALAAAKAGSVDELRDVLASACQTPLSIFPDISLPSPRNEIEEEEEEVLNADVMFEPLCRVIAHHLGDVLPALCDTKASERFPNNKDKVTVLHTEHVADADKQLGLLILEYHRRVHRRPLPFEILVCTQNTSDTDVDDFVSKWRLEHRGVFGRSDCLLFSVVFVERLPEERAFRLIKGVREALRFKDMDHSPLLILGGGDGVVSKGMREFDRHVSADEIHAVAAAAAKLVAQWPDHARVVRTAHAGMGKTRAILRRASSTGGGHYALLTVGRFATLDQLVPQLRTLAEELERIDKCTLHIDVSFDAPPDLVDEVVFRLIATRQLTDSSGRVVNVPAKCVQYVELASDPFGATAMFVQHLPCLAVGANVECDVPNFEPCGTSSTMMVHKVTFVVDPTMSMGAKFLVAFHAKKVNNDMSMRSGQHIRLDPVPPSATLTKVVRDLCANAHAAFRFMRFVTITLSHFFGETSLFEHMEMEDWMDQDYMAQVKFNCSLAFHFCELAVDVANNLASEAMPPAESATEGDDVRFKRMRPFSSWRNDPMLIANEGSEYRIVSLGASSALKTITRRNPNDHFHFMLVHNANLISELSRKELGTKCARVSMWSESYESDAPLPLLLGLISSQPKLSRIVFSTLERLQTQRHIPTDKFSTTTLADAERVLDGIGNCAQALRDIGVDLPEDCTLEQFQREVGMWLKTIFGSAEDGNSPPSVVTVDMLARLIAMKMRVVSGIPVVWVGETGCGKTHAVQLFARASGFGLFTININASLTAQDLWEALQPAIARALEKPRTSVAVQLDEFNSFADTWVIKQLLVDHTILGRRLPRNVTFIGIMNPMRYRTQEQLFAFESVDRLGGLNYSSFENSPGSPRTSETTVAHNSVPVYHVNKVPESIMSLAWDFGSVANNLSNAEDATAAVNGRTPLQATENTDISDEVVYAEASVNWMTTHELSRRFNTVSIGQRALGLKREYLHDRDGEKHMRAYRSIVCAMLAVSQRFLRESFGNEDSVVSLRDMIRVVRLVPFYMTCSVNKATCDGLDVTVSHPFFDFLTRATCAAFVTIYYLRLDKDRRRDYLRRLIGAWKVARAGGDFKGIAEDFMAAPVEADQIYEQGFDSYARYLCTCLPHTDGLAINEAMKENTMSMFAAFLNNMALMIVGRAGSSKTRSKESLINATDGFSEEKQCAFFQKFGKKLQKFVLQCSRGTTASEVLRVAKNAARHQEKNSSVISILVLEEVGVTLGSVHNPLMMLHSLIDHGVETDVGRPRVRIPILGISNWMLDGSKMNRALITHRGNPPVPDLIKTFQALCSTFGAPRGTEQFATVFNDRVLGGSKREYTHYYGMRDMYSFAATLESLRRVAFVEQGDQPDSSDTAPMRSDAVTSHLIRWVTRISFGGIPKEHEAAEGDLLRDITRSFPSDGARAEYVVTDGPSCRLKLCVYCAHMWFERIWSREQHRFLGPENETLMELCERKRQLFQDRTRGLDVSAQCEWFDDASRERCDGEVITYSLATKESRHLLVFTNTCNPVSVLTSMHLVDLSEEVTTVIFGNGSSTGVSQAARAHDLLRVKTRLRKGGTLVLVEAAHLYEALLDPLNMSYSVERHADKTVYRTRLPTADGYSQSVRVDPTFRCIVCCQEAHADKLLPPFLNRVTKARLSIAQLLSPRLRTIVHRVMERASIARNGATVSLLQATVPSFTEETVPSLALLEETIDQNRTEDEMLDFVETRIASVMSPRDLAIFEMGLDDMSEENMAVLKRYRDRICSTGDVPRGTDIGREIAEAWAINTYDNYTPRHGLLLTQQVGMRMRSVADVIVGVLRTDYELSEERRPAIKLCTEATSSSGVVDLNAADCDVAVAKALRDLCSPSVDDESTVKVGVFFVDASASVTALSRLMFQLSVRGKMDDDNEAATGPKLWHRSHVYVIVFVPGADVSLDNGVRNNFALAFQHGWFVHFLDEVVPSQPLTTLSCSHFWDQRMFLSEEGFADIGRSALLRSLNVFVQLGVAMSRADLERFICGTSLGKEVLMFCSRRILSCPGSPFANDEWRALALARMKSAGTLREALNLYVEAVWVRAFAQLILPLLGRGNLGAILEWPREASDLFERVVVPFMNSKSNVHAAFEVQLPPASPDPDQFSARKFNAAAYAPTCPFSGLLQSRLDDDDLFPLQETRETINIVSELPHPLSTNFARDVLMLHDGFTSVEAADVAIDVATALALNVDDGDTGDSDAPAARCPALAVHRARMDVPHVIELIGSIAREHGALPHLPRPLTQQSFVRAMAERYYDDTNCNVATLYPKMRLVALHLPSNPTQHDIVWELEQCVVTSRPTNRKEMNKIVSDARDSANYERCLEGAIALREPYAIHTLLQVVAMPTLTRLGRMIDVLSRDPNTRRGDITSTVRELRWLYFRTWLTTGSATASNELPPNTTFDAMAHAVHRRLCGWEGNDLRHEYLKASMTSQEQASDDVCKASPMHRVARAAVLSSTIFILCKSLLLPAGTAPPTIKGSDAVFFQLPNVEFAHTVNDLRHALATTCGSLSVDIGLSIVRQLSANGIDFVSAYNILLDTPDISTLVPHGVRESMRLAIADRQPLFAVKGFSEVQRLISQHEPPTVQQVNEHPTSGAVAVALSSTATATGTPILIASLPTVDNTRGTIEALLRQRIFSAPPAQQHNTDENVIAIHILSEALGGTTGVLRYYASIARQFHTTPTMELPGMTTSDAYDAVFSVPDANWLYVCPNGHHYTTGECEMISSQGTCPSCRAQVGGAAYGQPHAGNKRLGNIHAFRNKFEEFPPTLGYSTSRLAGQYPRNTTARDYHVARVLLQTCLLANRACFADGHDARTVDHYRADMAEELELLRRVIYPQATSHGPIIRWLHTVVTKLAGDLTACATRDDVEAVIKQTVDTCNPQAITQGDEERRLLLAIKCEGPEFTHEITTERSEERRHFRFRAELAPQLPSEYEDTMPVAAALARWSHCLSSTSARGTAALLRFIRLLWRVCASLRLYLKDAETTPMSVFLQRKDVPSELRVAFHKLQDAMPGLHFVARRQCTVLKDVPGFAEAVHFEGEALRVAHMLPSTEGLGLLAQILFDGTDMDNEQATIPFVQGLVFSAAEKAFSITNAVRIEGAPLLNVDERHLIHRDDSPYGDISAAALVRNVMVSLQSDDDVPQPTSNTKLVDTLLAIQTQATAQPRLGLALPSFPYAAPPGQCEGYVDLLTNRDLTLLEYPSDPAGLHILRQFRATPRLRTAVESYLILLMNTAHRNNDVTTCALDVPVPVNTLTDEQVNARGALEGERLAFHTCHARHLPLMLTIVWGGEVAAAASEAADTIDIDGVVAELETCDATRPLLPRILLALRLLGITTLSNVERAEASKDWPIVEALDHLVGDIQTALCIDIAKHPKLEALTCRHYAALLAVAEQRLPDELDQEKMSDSKGGQNEWHVRVNRLFHIAAQQTEASATKEKSVKVPKLDLAGKIIGNNNNDMSLAQSPRICSSRHHHHAHQHHDRLESNQVVERPVQWNVRKRKPTKNNKQ